MVCSTQEAAVQHQEQVEWHGVRIAKIAEKAGCDWRIREREGGRQEDAQDMQQLYLKSATRLRCHA